MDGVSEDVNGGIGVRPRDADKGDKTIPRSDTTVGVMVLPGLAMMAREWLSKHRQHDTEGVRVDEQTSPVMTMS